MFEIPRGFKRIPIGFDSSRHESTMSLTNGSCSVLNDRVGYDLAYLEVKRRRGMLATRMITELLQAPGDTRVTPRR